MYQKAPAFSVFSRGLTFLHPTWIFFLFLNWIFFIYFGCTALGLHCCTWAFSSCDEQGLLSSCSVHALHCGGFYCSEHGLSSIGSVFVVHGLSCPVACAVFPHQVSNPVPCISRETLNHQATREVPGYFENLCLLIFIGYLWYNGVITGTQNGYRNEIETC